MKSCIACGMPMTQIADYPLYDISKNYCKYCAHADGSMKNFEEKLDCLTKHYINFHKMDHIIAKQTAYVVLKKLPAWKRK
ncbi:zinc ribbon domain-containing protein [Orbus sturtevantii]|uniref:zinc ribbon domain-containing protein n=1 Tax=Orbus sturtevantii TaxID=3074109 RepID=UPI00370D696A